jgi:ABC-type cobalamin transport system permease subunit
MSRIKWLTRLGALLFIIGQVIGLALSGTVVWAELEARSPDLRQAFFWLRVFSGWTASLKRKK